MGSNIPKPQTGLIFGIVCITITSMADRKCVRAVCNGTISESAHWSQVYCSKQSKALGRYSTHDVHEDEDPLTLINLAAEQFRARYVRFGWRSNKSCFWWYYPAVHCQVPLEKIPPLPGPGSYRIILYNEKIEPDREHEFSLKITPSERCLITSGSRKIGVGS